MTTGQRRHFQRYAIASVLLIAALLCAVGLDGWPSTTATLILILAPPLIIRPVTGQGKVAHVWMALAITLVVGSLAVDGLNERYGLVNRIPVDGGSDQVDFIMMSWHWLENKTPGISVGGEAPNYILSYVGRNGHQTENPHLLDRWKLLAQEPSAQHAYAYRGQGYPMFLGLTWSLIGFRPEITATLNVLLLIFASLILAFAMKAFSFSAALAAGTAFSAFNEIIFWTGQALSETLSVFWGSLIAANITLIATRQRTRNYVYLGLSLGFLALTKPMFLPIGVLFLTVTLLIKITRTRSRTTFFKVRAGLMAISFAAVAIPLAAYNIRTTNSLALVAGTSGWVDMPSTWSESYLEGGNRFEIREDFFRDYERSNDVSLDTDVERALAARELWRDSLVAGDYWTRLPSLVALKVQRSIPTDTLGWILRILGAFLLLRRRRFSEKVSEVALPQVILLLLLMIFISLTVEDGPRLLGISWVMVASLLGLMMSDPGALLRRRDESYLRENRAL